MLLAGSLREHPAPRRALADLFSCTHNSVVVRTRRVVCAEKPKPRATRSKRATRAKPVVDSEPDSEPKPEAKAEPKDVQPESTSRGKDYSAYYLFKNEPDDFNIDDLANEPDQTTCWEGVRNFRARNIMRSMEVGQRAFFYHSNCKTPGIVGCIRIAKAAYTDHTQFDSSSKYYDAKAKEDEPKWSMVDVQLEEKFEEMITLEELKKHKAGELKSMQLLTAARLSVQNVTESEWGFIASIREAKSK